MAITFPTSPSLNDTHTAGDIIWTWNGSSWESTVVGTGMDNVVEDTTPQLGGALDTNGNNITFSGSNKAEFGAAQDLAIWHNGNHSIVRETGTGDLYLQSDNNVILATDSGTKKMIKGIGNGATELYHNDNLRLNTSTSGITVNGEVHTEGATPHLTLKRTNNANVPTLRFKGSGGTTGASIDFDGTSGDSNTLIVKTYDGVSLAERFRVGHTATTVAGNLVVSGDFTVNGTTTTVNTTEMTVSDNIITLNNDVTGAPSENAGIEVERGSSSNVSIRWNETSDQWEFTNDGASYTALGSGGGGGGLANIVDDISPQLGGNLDANGNNISLPDSSRIIIGTGNDSELRWDAGDNEARYSATGDIQLAPSGRLQFNTGGTDRWQFTSAGHLLPEANASYDIGSADYKVRHLFLSDNSLKFVDASDVVYTLSVNGGQLEFEGSPVGGIASLVDDTSPQLGGTLDLNLQSITSQGNISIQTVVNPYPIDIGTSSVSGSAVNIGSQALNTPVNISGESNFGAHATFDRGVHERFYTITGATGTVTHNCWWGHLWYHTGVAANFTANITNLGLEQEDATNVAIVINQGNTGYIPNAIEIAGVAQTITWQGNSAPTPTDNGIDTFSFTILNRGGVYVVLGQMTSFGGV